MAQGQLFCFVAFHLVPSLLLDAVSPRGVTLALARLRPDDFDRCSSASALLLSSPRRLSSVGLLVPFAVKLNFYGGLVPLSLIHLPLPFL